jgi:putative addiction module component (TIGR02574 family)
MELSLEERSWLAEQLWDSARTAKERDIDAVWVVEIERRLKEIEEGTATLIPAEEVFRELRDRRLTDAPSTTSD